MRVKGSNLMRVKGSNLMREKGSKLMRVKECRSGEVCRSEWVSEWRSVRLSVSESMEWDEFLTIKVRYNINVKISKNNSN